jgi:aspartyl-tRNA(Asn)/glutamyl-tRNA(Gln) amidotransferase subunit A
MVSALEIRESIRSGRASAVEVCQATLTRIEALNPVLNAFHSVEAERALARAAGLDARRAEDGHLPLFGVPVALKDNLCTRGALTTAGSRSISRLRSQAASTSASSPSPKRLRVTPMRSPRMSPVSAAA